MKRVGENEGFILTQGIEHVRPIIKPAREKGGKFSKELFGHLGQSAGFGES